MHTIIVIDEVDLFSAFEKSFTLLVRGILAQEAKANTSLIGIANSVDLPFKKKHSAIAMRDCQLLFEPYSCDQLINIIEQKLVHSHEAIEFDVAMSKFFVHLVE
jgi:Cdc6-like AAA superfamily ATPase